MLRTLMAATAGALAGYTLARAVEARAHGIPVSLVLSNWATPVAALKADLLVATRPRDPDAPMPPSFMFQGLQGEGFEDED